LRGVIDQVEVAEQRSTVVKSSNINRSQIRGGGDASDVDVGNINASVEWRLSGGKVLAQIDVIAELRDQLATKGVGWDLEESKVDDGIILNNAIYDVLLEEVGGDGGELSIEFSELGKLGWYNGSSATSDRLDWSWDGGSQSREGRESNEDA